MAILDRLRTVDFLPLVHKTFHVQLPDLSEPIPLELVQVTETGPRQNPEKSTGEFNSETHQPFALLFLGPMS